MEVSAFDDLLSRPASVEPGETAEISRQYDERVLSRQIERLLQTRRPPLPTLLKIDGRPGQKTGTSACEDRLLGFGQELPPRDAINETQDLQRIEDTVKDCVLRNLPMVRHIDVITELSPPEQSGRSIVPIELRVYADEDHAILSIRLDRLARQMELTAIS